MLDRRGFLLALGAGAALPLLPAFAGLPYDQQPSSGDRETPRQRPIDWSVCLDGVWYPVGERGVLVGLEGVRLLTVGQGASGSWATFAVPGGSEIPGLGKNDHPVSIHFRHEARFVGCVTRRSEHARFEFGEDLVLCEVERWGVREVAYLSPAWDPKDEEAYRLEVHSIVAALAQTPQSFTLVTWHRLD